MAWPTGLPLLISTLTDGTLIKAQGWLNAVVTPISNGFVALLGDATWTVPALTNSWVSFDGGSTFTIPAYRKWGELVMLRGLIKNGAGVGSANAMFTLPVGLRPSSKLTFLVDSSIGGAAYLIVDTTGAVYVSSYLTGGSNAFVQLDGVVFIGA